MTISTNVVRMTIHPTAPAAVAIAPRVLLAYASSYGQTEKIAHRIADVLRRGGLDVTLWNARVPQGSIDAASFDGFVVGASIIARGHQPSIREFIRRHRTALDRVPSAFFSVCASAGSVHARNREAAHRLRDAFLDETGWSPVHTASFAGAIKFTQYNWILRWYMKKASELNGGSTDTSRDHEYTDWSEVERFAREFSADVGAASAGAHM